VQKGFAGREAVGQGVSAALAMRLLFDHKLLDFCSSALDDAE